MLLSAVREIEKMKIQFLQSPSCLRNFAEAAAPCIGWKCETQITLQQSLNLPELMLSSLFPPFEVQTLIEFDARVPFSHPLISVLMIQHFPIISCWRLHNQIFSELWNFQLTQKFSLIKLAGEFRSKVACENDVISFECNPYSRIAINTASFGRTEYESLQCPQKPGIKEESEYLS